MFWSNICFLFSSVTEKTSLWFVDINNRDSEEQLSFSRPRHVSSSSTYFYTTPWKVQVFNTTGKSQHNTDSVRNSSWYQYWFCDIRVLKLFKYWRRANRTLLTCSNRKRLCPKEEKTGLKSVVQNISIIQIIRCVCTDGFMNTLLYWLERLLSVWAVMSLQQMSCKQQN